MTTQSESKKFEPTPLKEYNSMKYECVDCGFVEHYNGLAVKIRSPFRDETDDADCTICRMRLVDQEDYWSGEIEPDNLWLPYPWSEQKETEA